MIEETKTENAWGIVNEDGELLSHTIRHSPAAVIDDFIKDPGYDYPEGTDTREKRWRWLKRRGNRCVPVKITYGA
jgi:hypothetical protein